MGRTTRFLRVAPPAGAPPIGTATQGGYIGSYVSYDSGVTVYALIVSDISGETSAYRFNNASSIPGTSFTDGWYNRSFANTTSTAVRHCINYRGGDFADWFWGAFHEMMAILENLNPVATTGTGRLTSTIGYPQKAGAISQTDVVLFQSGNAQAFGQGVFAYGTSSDASNMGGVASQYIAVRMGGSTNQNGVHAIYDNTTITRIRPIRKVLASAL